MHSETASLKPTIFHRKLTLYFLSVGDRLHGGFVAAPLLVKYLSDIKYVPVSSNIKSVITSLAMPVKLQNQIFIYLEDLCCRTAEINSTAL